ncbi:MAG: GNAT family N-acetyltransferase, partial [Oscillospiraceae bacterium]|nr:GNAT family N-acetyltransferase [Oscillospiraceae bacterium]
GSRVVGSVWCRLMDDYGHIDDETPSLAAALYPEYRGQGIGTELLRAMMDALEREGVRQVSLSVQKGNPAVRLYRRVGFRIIRETEEEYIMVDRLGRASSGKEHAHAGQAGGRGGPIQPDRGQAGRAGDL